MKNVVSTCGLYKRRFTDSDSGGSNSVVMRVSIYQFFPPFRARLLLCRANMFTRLRRTSLEKSRRTAQFIIKSYFLFFWRVAC